MNNFGYWLTFSVGAVAQTFFAIRQLIQWISTEKAKKVQNPVGFWAFSYLGCLAMLVYGWMRNDFAIIFGQFIAYYIYVWNLGNKQVFDSLKRSSRVLLVALVCIIPLIGLSVLFKNPETAISSLFSADSIATWLVFFGTAGQLVWSFRLIYQFLYSYRRGISSLPLGYWIISMAGSLMIVAYAVIRADIVLGVGQTLSTVPIVRNLYFIWKNSRQER